MSLHLWLVKDLPFQRWTRLRHSDGPLHALHHGMYPGDMRTTILVQTPCFPCFCPMFFLKSDSDLWNSTSKWNKHFPITTFDSRIYRVSTWSLWFFVEWVLEKNVCFFQKIFGCVLGGPPPCLHVIKKTKSARSFENIVRKQQPVKHLNGL